MEENEDIQAEFVEKPKNKGGRPKGSVKKVETGFTDSERISKLNAGIDYIARNFQSLLANCQDPLRQIQAAQGAMELISQLNDKVGGDKNKELANNLKLGDKTISKAAAVAILTSKKASEIATILKSDENKSK